MNREQFNRGLEVTAIIGILLSGLVGVILNYYGYIYSHYFLIPAMIAIGITFIYTLKEISLDIKHYIDTGSWWR